MATLARLRGRGGHGHLGPQAFPEPPAILQQDGAQGLRDPFGGQRLAALSPLREALEERFGFAVAFALDLLEFFAVAAAS